MKSYLICIKHNDGFENVIEVEPMEQQSFGHLPGDAKQPKGRWNVQMPVSNTWQWAKLGHYYEAGMGIYVFRDTGQPGDLVFRLEQFSDPPPLASSNTAAFSGFGASNATWTVLANESQLAEIKQMIGEMQAEINDIYRQMMLDVVGCFDPTPISDTIGATMAFSKGEMINGCLSLVSIVPYIGDVLGKSIKGTRLATRLANVRIRFKTLIEVLEKLKQRMKTAAKEAAEKLLENTRKKLVGRMNAVRKTITKQITEVAARAGLKPEHLNNWRVFCTQCEPPKLAILRNRNPASMKWEGLPGYIPKPTDVKLKTAKTGPHAGLVVYPKAPLSAGDIKDIQKLKDKGYKFESDTPGALLLSPKGEKIHGDMDKMGIYNVNTLDSGRTHASSWKGTRHNDAIEMQNDINKRVYENIKNDQHGGQDFFYGKFMDSDKAVADGYDEVAQIWSMGRHPDPDEMFTIIHPNGDVGTVDLKGLEKIYSQYGIQNPYNLK